MKTVLPEVAASQLSGVSSIAEATVIATAARAVKSFLSSQVLEENNENPKFIEALSCCPSNTGGTYFFKTPI